MIPQSITGQDLAIQTLLKLRDHWQFLSHKKLVIYQSGKFATYPDHFLGYSFPRRKLQNLSCLLSFVWNSRCHEKCGAFKWLSISFSKVGERCVSELKNWSHFHLNSYPTGLCLMIILLILDFYWFSYLLEQCMYQVMKSHLMLWQYMVSVFVSFQTQFGFVCFVMRAMPLTLALNASWAQNLFPHRPFYPIWYGPGFKLTTWTEET